jgi:DNA-binding NtrC family response regulator
LAEHFTSEFAGRLGKRLTLPAATREILCAYDFPGNVRELKNVIERAAILAPGASLDPELLPDRMREAPRVRGPLKLGLHDASASGLTLEFRPGQDTLDGFERRLLEEALRMAGGKKAKASEILGISRFALLRRIEKFGLS